MKLYTILDYGLIFTNLEDAIKALDENRELKWFDTDCIKMEKEPFYEGCIELFPIKTKYIKPIYAIAQELTKNEIPYTLNAIYDGLQIRFPWMGGDIACHGSTYGHDFWKVESFECPWDNEDVTCLSPTEAVTLISEWYEKVN